MNFYLVGAVVLVSLGLGLGMGYLAAKFVSYKRNKKLIKNAKEVIEGKRENYIEIEGKKYPAERFKVRNEDGREVIIDLKGGLEKDVNKKDKERKESFRKDSSFVREDSRSNRKKKRDSGRRDRIRRFG